MAAEIATAGGTSCASAAQVIGMAKGSAYVENFYSCTPTSEGAGSTWASAWKGTYTEYVCQSPSMAEVAFNYGKDYTG